MEILVPVGIYDYLFRNKSELGGIAAFYSSKDDCKKERIVYMQGNYFLDDYLLMIYVLFLE